MNIFSSLEQARLYIVRIWESTIRRQREDIDRGFVRIEIIEEDIVEIEEDVEENSEEILATKSEVKEVRDLLALLVFELTDMGFDFKDERLVKLIEEYDKIEI